MAAGLQIAVLTRPAGRNVDVMHALVRRGWLVRECPALEIQSSAVISERETPDPNNFDLVVFVSRAAVSGFQQQLGPDFVWPSAVRVGCMGPATASAVERAWPTARTVLRPEAQQARDSEALWPLLQQLPITLRKVLIVRGQDGRDWLAQKLANAGVEVVAHQAYERVYAGWSDESVAQFREWAELQAEVVWLLTSAHGISAIVERLAALELLDWFRSGQFVLTHERLVQTLASAADTDPSALRIRVCPPEDSEIVLCFDQILPAGGVP